MKNEEKKQKGIFGKVYKVFSGQLRSIDRFGYPVSLTYKNNQTYTSGFGGCMTILSVFSLIIYFGFMLNDVIQRKRYIITESTYLRDLYTDTTDFKFTQNTFDYAVYPAYSGSNSAVTNMHQYFSLKFYTIYQSQRENYTEGQYPTDIAYTDVNYTQCTPDRFNGEPARAGLSLVGWLCPNFTDLTLQGKSSSVISKKFRFEVTYCETNYLKKMFPNLECKPTAEADAIIQDTFIIIAYLEQYLDVGEFNRSPLKNTIQSFQLPLTDDSRLDWYFLSENYLVLQDSYMASSIGTQNLTYTKSRNLLTTFQKRAGRKLFLQQSFLIDDLVRITQRTTYNLIDALTATGGFASIIMIIFKTLTSRIQKVLYFTSIMKKLYLYMDDKFKHEIFKLEMNSNNQNQRNNEFQNSYYEKNEKQDANQYQIQGKNGANDQQLKNNKAISKVYLLNNKKFQIGGNEDGQPFKNSLVKQKTMEMKTKLKKLKFFNYTYTEHLKSKFVNLFNLCQPRKTQNIKEMLYQIGVEKLSKEFDMVRHLKKIRVADSIAELTLSQFQRQLLPYFDRNILNVNAKSVVDLKSKNLTLDADKDLQTSLKKIIIDSKKSAIDQRIIDNLASVQETSIDYKNEFKRQKKSKIICEYHISGDQQKQTSIKEGIKSKDQQSKQSKNHKSMNTKQQESNLKIKQDDQDGANLTNFLETPKKNDFNDTGKKLLSNSKLKQKAQGVSPRSEQIKKKQTKKKVDGKSKKSTNKMEITGQNKSDHLKIDLNINPKLKNNFINISSSPVTSDADNKSPKNKNALS
eukprot:403349499